MWAGHRPTLAAMCSLCLQAFAQVMLLQQETIASLMQLLEEAKAEAAAVLAPLTRPASPTKRRALESEQEAQGRVRQDRWGHVHSSVQVAGRHWRGACSVLSLLVWLELVLAI